MEINRNSDHDEVTRKQGRRYYRWRNGHRLATAKKSVFFAIEIWESRQALDHHMQTPHFKAAAARFSELVQGTLDVDILDPIGQ